LLAKLVLVEKADSFFPDVQKLFRDKFGRDMTADERKWFALAEHAVRNEEEKRQ
jgi:hypothetical protein